MQYVIKTRKEKISLKIGKSIYIESISTKIAFSE